jgi:hypothetical protein
MLAEKAKVSRDALFLVDGLSLDEINTARQF